MKKRLICAISVLSLLSCLNIGYAEDKPKNPPAIKAAELQTFIPDNVNTPLNNPDMGLYIMVSPDTKSFDTSAWYAPCFNIAYVRDDWAVLEPDKEGEYKFETYFDPIFKYWVETMHKRVAFRFMSSNMHSSRQYVTPKWVFDSGVPGIQHKGIYVTDQTDPVFWDDKYLETQEKFIADLGKYLDGKPGLEFIDIGGIGEWGEMHLSRWTSDQLENSGYSPDKYIQAYRRLIDAYVKAFPHTRIFLNVGDYDTINDYAAIHGVGFRQDGLSPNGPSSDVGNRFYRPYAKRGTVCNYELFADYEGMKKVGWSVSETLAKGLQDPISYMNINLMGLDELKKADDYVKEPVLKAARRIGYRFTLSKLSCNKEMHILPEKGGRILINHTWTNTGVAPCYKSYALEWSLTNEYGQVVAKQIDFPVVPTTHWSPDAAINNYTIFRYPSGIAEGLYRLRVAMINPDQPKQHIELALGSRGDDGVYSLCSISAHKETAIKSLIYNEDFEKDSGVWQAEDGMRISKGTDAHGGSGSLNLTGTQPGTSWAYAFTPSFTLTPGSRYRLTAWMKVDSIPADSHAPYLKVGLYDQNGHFQSNANTNTYDTSQLGTWQQLTTYVETDDNTNTGNLAIEKGVFTMSVPATMQVDDISLELLEMP